MSVSDQSLRRGSPSVREANEPESASDALSELSTQSRSDDAAVDALPCCIEPLAECCVYSAYRPEDSFDDRQRKLFVAISAGNATFLTLYAILFCGLVAEDANLATILGLICAILYVLAGPVLYIVVRATGRASAVLIDIYLAIVILGITSLILTTNLPMVSSLVLIVTVATQCECTVLWVHLVLATIALSIATYNEIAMGMKWPFARVPGWQKVTMPVMLTQCAFVYLMYMVSGFAMLRIGVARRKALTRATVSASTAVALADALVDYDTERVRDTIGAAEGEADGMLLKAFAAMCTNLEVYRPHLPNWLLQQQHDLVHGTAEAGGDDGDGALSLRSSRGVPDKQHEQLSSHVTSIDERPSSRMLLAVSVGAASDRSGRRSAPLHDSNDNGLGGSDLAISRRSSVRSSDAHGGVGGRKSSSAPHTPAQQSTTATVAIAVIPFGFESSAPDAAVSAFVAAVHAAAGLTRGSVHSFTGDCLVLSWNATTRVARPDSRAASCLARIKTWLDSADGIASTVTASGAAMTGAARCQLAGTTLRAAMVSAPWMPALQALARHACALGPSTFLADEKTHTGAHYEVEMLPVDTVNYAPRKTVRRVHAQSPPGRRRDSVVVVATPEVAALGSTSSLRQSGSVSNGLKVYEIVQVFDGTSEEWMYTLERQNNATSPSGLLEQAFQCIAAGDGAGAAVTAAALPEAVQQRPAVAALMAKLALHASDDGSHRGGSTFATVLECVDGPPGGTRSPT